MTAFLTSFALIAVAEMADKTQLLTLCLTCRYPARTVLLGVSLTIAVLNLLAVAVGGALGEFLPVGAVRIAAGLIFLGFGVWVLLGTLTPDSDDEETCETSPSRNALVAVALAFFVAEIGDKTQLAALSLAARFEALFAVWLGASLGMILANGLAVGGGAAIGTRISETALKRLSGMLFMVFGALTLVTAL